MTIKDLASKVRGNVLITVENEKGESAMYNKDGTFVAASSAHELDENTLIEFRSDYWNMIKDDIIELDVTGLRMVGHDYSGSRPGLIVYVNMCHDDEPITEELLVETEEELNDAMQDDSFDRIRLACNIELAHTMSIYDCTKTLDLAEHTLSNRENGAVILVGEDANLTIIGDGVVHGNNAAIMVVDGGKLTIEDGAYICGTGSEDSRTRVIYVQHGKALINGGAFSNSDTNGKLLDILEQTMINADIEVRGGKFVGEDPVPFLAEGYIITDEDVDGVNVYAVSKQ